MNEKAPAGALLVFTKAPVEGQVKTRLIPELGRRGALDLYEELLTATLDTAMKAGFSSLQIWVSGDVEHSYFKKFKNQHNVNFYEQKGEDLGERMFHAFDTALHLHDYAVIIGCDCPSLEYTDLIAAKDYLENKTNVVLGPAVDGGYYLIALRNIHREVFADIKWGEASVFSDTCANIESLNWTLGLLEKRWDVDRPADLVRYFKFKEEAAQLTY